MNNDERQQWVENDEGLYNWWKRSRLSMREFLRTHRAQIDDVIRNVTGGTRQAHYLEYEDEAPSPAESCSLCGGGLYPLGTLGRLQHLRCRNCGAEFSRQATPRANSGAKKRATLPLDHPIRSLPDDLRLYHIVCAELQTHKFKRWPDDNLDFTQWVYTQARELHIPTECVSKVINLAGLYPGGDSEPQRNPRRTSRFPREGTPADLEHPPWEKSFESLQRRRSVQCPQCDRPLEDCVCVSDLPQPKRYPAFVKTARDRALWDRAVEQARQKHGEPIRYAYATYLFKKMGGGRWGDGR